MKKRGILQLLPLNNNKHEKTIVASNSVFDQYNNCIKQVAQLNFLEVIESIQDYLKLDLKLISCEAESFKKEKMNDFLTHSEKLLKEHNKKLLNEMKEVYDKYIQRIYDKNAIILSDFVKAYNTCIVYLIVKNLPLYYQSNIINITLQYLFNPSELFINNLYTYFAEFKYINNMTPLLILKKTNIIYISLQKELQLLYDRRSNHDCEFGCKEAYIQKAIKKQKNIQEQAQQRKKYYEGLMRSREAQGLCPNIRLYTGCRCHCYQCVGENYD
jgi:hypothetical protein